jgi:hypothetical protein
MDFDCRPSLAILSLSGLLLLAAPPATDAQTARPDSTPAPATAPAPASPGIAPPKLGGYVQARGTWQERIGSTFSINRARLTGDGSLPNRFTYRFAIEFASGGSARTAATPSLRDAFIRWTRGAFAIQGGQFKTPFSRNFVTSLSLLETIDRPAVVDTLATRRDLGIMGEALWNLGTLSAGVFNGGGQNIPANGDSTTLIVARGTVRPIAPLSLGASGAAYGSDSTRWGLEASVEQKGWLARGEWIQQHRNHIADDDHGWFVLGAARVVPWLQLVVMQEDLLRPHLGFGARNRATTVETNVDLGASRTRLTVGYIARRSGPAQTSRSIGIAQLQVRF